jgi:DNA-binding transcriptional regulator YiaG
MVELIYNLGFTTSIRNVLNVSMRGFQSQFGIQTTSVCMWENGQRTPLASNIGKLYDLCQQLGVDIPLFTLESQIVTPDVPEIESPLKLRKVSYNKDLTKLIQEKTDLKQKDLAKLLDVDGSTIFRWETSSMGPNGDHLAALYSLVCQYQLEKFPAWRHGNKVIDYPVYSFTELTMMFKETLL